MKWLADYYSAHGVGLSRSDITLGAPRAENVHGADLVVYSAAVPPTDPERSEAARLGIKQISRAEALASVMACFGESIAVAGTHGKTTTVCMLGEMLSAYDPAVCFGGTCGGRRGKASGEIIVAEACEYMRGMLFMRPTIAVVLNAELDHTDCYAGEREVRDAFSEFVSRAEIAVAPDTLIPCMPKRYAVTVGRTGEYACIDSRVSADGMTIAVKTPDGVKRFRMRVPGAHNAENAVFAIAAARAFGADWSEIAGGLERFRGADRRLQRVGSMNGVPVFSDYAHHPTELAASLAAYRAMGYKKPLVVFQPHTHERLGAFFDEFAEVLLTCDSIVLPVFRARGADEGRSSADLAAAVRERGGRSEALGFEEAADRIKNAAPVIDVIAVTGAGDNERLLPFLLDQSSPNE